MNCKSVKEILLEKEIGGEIPAEIMAHLDSCTECSEFLEQVQSEDIKLSTLKNSKPVLDYPDALTYSIMNKIIAESETNESLFEKIQNCLMVKQVRLALYSVIVFFTVGYFYEESTALNSVISLENKLNAAGTQYNASLTDNLPNLSFLYDVYKLLTGETKHLKLSEEWLVVNKEFLRKLFAEYDSLSPQKKKEFEELRKTFTKEQNEFVDELLNSKNKSLK